MSQIIKFPDRRTSELRKMVRKVIDEEVGPGRNWGRPYTRRGANMQTFVFRSYDLIAEADEAELLHDVRQDIPKAETKLRKAKEALRAKRKRYGLEIEMLEIVETKLSAALVAALLSNQGQR
jgi:hypothetical protein